jgi:hypothetical protein
MGAGSGIGGWGHLPFRRVFCKKSGGKIFDGFDQRPAKHNVPQNTTPPLFQNGLVNQTFD